MPRKPRITRCTCPECKNRGKVHQYLACRRKANPSPDDTRGIDITGRYEDDQIHPQFTCQINQAGIHIEGWLQFTYVAPKGECLSRKIAEVPRQVYILSGDFDLKSKEFLFAVYDDWSKTERSQGVGMGFLKPLSKNRLSMKMNISQANGKASTDVRTKLRSYTIRQKIPRLSEYMLATLPQTTKAEIMALETAPLPTPYIKELQQEFSPTYIRLLIADWYKMNNEVPSIRDRYQQIQLSKLAGKTKAFFCRFHPSLWPTLRFYVHSHLSVYRYQKGSTRSLIDELAVIAAKTAGYLENKDRYEILKEKGLNLSWEPKIKEPIVYEAQVKLQYYQLSDKRPRAKGPMGAGVVRGTITIKKVITPTKPAVVFKNQIYFTVISLGLSVGYNYQIETSGTTLALADWQAVDFNGDAVMYDLSSWFGMAAGGSYGIMHLRIYGNRAHAPLNLNLSGWSKTLGQGGGISGSILFGYLRPTGEKLPDKKIISEPKDFPLSSKGTTKTHFNLGCAVLDGEGRALVRRFCAKELFFLQSPSSSLVLDGHTDTVDCARRNEELSKLRIMNVLQAIKDTLHKKMLIMPDNIKTHPYGETQAGEKIENDTEDRSWRKVEVTLNGRGMMRLQA